MRCPHCRHRLLQKSDFYGKVKLRVPILVFDFEGGNCTTACPSCKRDIPLPVTLAKSAIQDDDPKLILNKGLRPKIQPA